LIASIVAGTAVYVGALVAIQFRQIRALAIQMIELVKRKTPNSR
jgi:hypothetical protein